MTVTFTAPTLQTDRLTLRAPQVSDAPAFAAFFGSERSKFVGGPIAPERAWRVLAQEAGHWELRGFGRWGPTEKGDNTPIGIGGLW